MVVEDIKGAQMQYNSVITVDKKLLKGYVCKSVGESVPVEQFLLTRNYNIIIIGRQGQE